MPVKKHFFAHISGIIAKFHVSNTFLQVTTIKQMYDIGVFLFALLGKGLCQFTFTHTGSAGDKYQIMFL